MKPSKKRIAFVANTSWSIYKFRLYLLETLVKKGFDIYILAPRDSYSHYLENIPGIQFIELNWLRGKSVSPIDDLRFYYELKENYRQIAPDIIFHYTIKPNIFGAMAAAANRMMSICVVTGLGYAFSVKGWVQTLASMLYRRALKKAREVWFLNTDDQQLFIDARLTTNERCYLLPGEGVDTNFFYPVPYAESKLPVVFLLIGRLNAHKGIPEFVKAASILRHKKLDAKFLLLGFSDEKSAVAISTGQIREWENQGIISYLGETDDVTGFISQADCVVLPSYREGMPLSLMEGASMCKALIATDVPGCHAVVKDGLNGYLCKVGDADDLADKMERYYHLPAAQKKALGEAGRQRIQQHFSREKIIAAYLEKLQALLP